MSDADFYQGGLVKDVSRFRAFVRVRSDTWHCASTSDDRRTAERYAHDMYGANAKVQVLPFPQTPESNEQRSE